MKNPKTSQSVSGYNDAKTCCRKTGFFSHPDYTVGPGVSPDLSLPSRKDSRAVTAGQDFPPSPADHLHPEDKSLALRTPISYLISL
jgi:hypothetical protein